MNNLLKLLKDGDGDPVENGKWHIADQSVTNDTARILCTGESIDCDSYTVAASKAVLRGGITCNNCLATVKKYKDIKL